MTTNLPRPLRGIVPPLVTPLLEQDRLDIAGLERLIEHQIAGGVHGLFILGTTGEGPSLSQRLQLEVVQRTTAQVRGRLPVLVGISDTSMVESLAVARQAAEAGCDAVVATPPYYMPFSQAESIRYFQQLAAQLPLPLFLYNFPLLTKNGLEPAAVQQLLDTENIVGLKDSSGDLFYFERIMQLQSARPDFSVLAGKEINLAKVVALGGHGGVCGGANIWPRLFVDLFDAAVAGKEPEIDALLSQVKYLGEIYSAAGDEFSAVIVGTKIALGQLGICSDVLAAPIRPPTDEARAIVRGVVDSLGLSS